MATNTRQTLHSNQSSGKMQLVKEKGKKCLVNEHCPAYLGFRRSASIKLLIKTKSLCDARQNLKVTTAAVRYDNVNTKQNNIKAKKEHQKAVEWELCKKQITKHRLRIFNESRHNLSTKHPWP